MVPRKPRSPPPPPSLPLASSGGNGPPPVPTRNYKRISEEPIVSPRQLRPQVLKLECSECGYPNIPGSTLCNSCSSPLVVEPEDVGADLVVEMPETQLCVECGHLNVLGTQRCAGCGADFAQTDSVVQEVVLDGIMKALSLAEPGEDSLYDGTTKEEQQLQQLDALLEGYELEEQIEEDQELAVARLLAQPSSGSEDEEASPKNLNQSEVMSSMIAPDFAAPEPPRPPSPPPSTSPSSSPLAFDDVTDRALAELFVADSHETQGWEPSLTVNVGDGIERYTRRGDPLHSKAVTVLSKTQLDVTEMTLWPLSELTRYEDRMTECRLLKQVSNDEAILHCIMDFPGLGKQDLIVRRVRGGLVSGERYIFMSTCDPPTDVPVVRPSELVFLDQAGFVMLPTADVSTKCTYVCKYRFKLPLPTQHALALSRSVFSVLNRVRTRVATIVSRPPPPKKAPQAVRKLTIVKIAVPLKCDRDKVANEILTSEQVYFQALLILRGIYLGPLLHWAAVVENTMIYDTFQRVGIACDSLIPYNQGLLTELEKKMRAWSDEETLGDVFHMVGRFQSIYTKYLEAYEDMVPKIAQCEKNTNFMALLKEFKKNAKGQQLDLRSYLIMPVQRFPRYELLLRDLLKATPESHKDVALIRTALTKVEGVNSGINDAMREIANKKKLDEIIANFVADPGLKAPGRALLKDGVLVKQCHNGLANRKFWLFNDMIVYAKIIPGTDRYLLSEKLPLNKVHLEDLPDNLACDPPIQYAFELNSNKKSFAVYAPSQDEKVAWMLSVSKATALQLQSASPRGTTGEPIVDILNNSEVLLAPKWQQDNTADRCPFCSTKFTLIVRKHHCRLCGSLSCASCTSDRVVVKSWGEEPQRVCKSCFATDREGVVRINATEARTISSIKGSIGNLVNLSRGSVRKGDDSVKSSPSLSRHNKNSNSNE